MIKTIIKKRLTIKRSVVRHLQVPDLKLVVGGSTHDSAGFSHCPECSDP